MRPEGPAQTAPMRARPRASRAGGRFHAPRRSLRSRPFMRSGIATDGTIARRLGGQSRRRPCRTRRHAARTASAAVRSCSQETATDGTVARAGSRASRAPEAELISSVGDATASTAQQSCACVREWQDGSEVALHARPGCRSPGINRPAASPAVGSRHTRRHRLWRYNERPRKAEPRAPQPRSTSATAAALSRCSSRERTLQPPTT